MDRENLTNSTNSTENKFQSHGTEESTRASRGRKSLEAGSDRKAVIADREFPEVTALQETGLLLFRAGIFKTHIGPKLGRSRDWFGWNYKHNEKFREYVGKIEIELLTEIRENSIPVSIGMFRILESIAIGEYDRDQKIQAGKLALAYLEKTGRLPKSDDKEEEDRKIEQAVQSLSTALAEKFGNEFAL
ncbi:hypothetical protein LPTSP4_36240 [Leptospira ryugenii]|uniref:Uncharacterized protein n=1 Tax=Leptospira ryugenii TaxID=1917863 RepID=A0A2P2E5E3_9LEPT|nr:hypothetical protein [Leptospira ryugenii]GBF52086.1 hypothetical protein LPTSP4_36240 [Leptospira ryugenii]